MTMLDFGEILGGRRGMNEFRREAASIKLPLNQEGVRGVIFQK